MKDSIDIKSIEKILFPSRANYADVIVDKILKVSDQSGRTESYVIGLSARWGEGKSFFLKQVQNKIEDVRPELKVLWFSPWEFAKDRNSLMRKFLNVIDTEKKIKEDRYRQRTELLINGRRLGLILLVWFISSLVFFILFECGVLSISLSFTDSMDWFIKLTPIPLVIGALSQVITSSIIKPACEDLDEFKKVFEEILPPKTELPKIVVFVDDLDRCLPSECRDVLDYLRTFLASPHIIYIVAGDHDTLEISVGRDIISARESDEKDALFEGRRYLKKIFDIYWRIPLPMNKEFEAFLESDIFNKNSKDFEKIYKASKDSLNKEYIELCLKTFFNRNLREIDRFTDHFLFAYETVTKGLNVARKDGDKEILEFYTDVLNNPKLLLRTMLMQDFCSPVFEYFIENINEFEKLEWNGAIGTLTQQEINETASKAKLNRQQSELFYKLMLFQPHFFAEDKSMKVKAFEPFFYLSASRDLNDLRGIAPEEFWNIFNEPDYLKLAKLQIEKASQYRIDLIIEFLQDKYRVLEANYEKNDGSYNRNEPILKLSKIAETLTHTSKNTNKFDKLFSNFDFNLLSKDHGFGKRDAWKVYIRYYNWIQKNKVDITILPKELSRLCTDGLDKFLQGEILDYFENLHYEFGDVYSILTDKDFSQSFHPIKSSLWNLLIKNDQFLYRIASENRDSLEKFLLSDYFGLEPKEKEAISLLKELLLNIQKHEKNLAERKHKENLLLKNKGHIFKNLTIEKFEEEFKKGSGDIGVSM